MYLKLHRIFILVAAALLAVSTSGKASGEFEWGITAGTWTAFLPEYETGYSTGGDGSPLLSADQNDLGGRVQAHGFYHFAPTRTMLEMRASLAGADIASQASTSDIRPALVTAHDTNIISTSEVQLSVRSRTLYNDAYIGLRDQFDLTNYWFGLVTLGCGLSHMHFDTTYDSRFDFAPVGIFAYAGDTRENLKSSYLGGEIVASMARQFFGRDVLLDTRVGIHELNADYKGRYEDDPTIGFPLANGSATESFNGTAYTFALTLKTTIQFAGVEFHPTTGVQYISSMPGIANRTTVADSRLRDDDAFILNGGWEFVF